MIGTFFLPHKLQIFSQTALFRRDPEQVHDAMIRVGMIFQGPQLMGEINRDLVKLLRKDGFSSIAEARGKE